MIGQDELRRLEDKCIQECAPTCAAMCPVHLDVRGLAAAVAKGDFAAGLKLLTRSIPFPGTISRICDAPCQAGCKRNEAGDSIGIRALERACVEFGGSPAKPKVLPRRGKTVAVIGGGLSGLTAAYDLARKGYAVSIFEARNSFGGRLLDYPEDVLPRQTLCDELAVVESVFAEISLSAGLLDDNLAALRRECDALFLAIGWPAETTFGLAVDEFGRVVVDPVTFATNMDGVFAGGDMLRTGAERSPIRAISDGRRAAISIDRYLQKVSLSASRSDEGSYATRLYTSTAGIAPLAAVHPSNPSAGYSRDEAIAEASRCIQCECMECVKNCEYMRAFGRYPRKYLREIYNNLAIVKGERKSNQFINSCSLCGLCAEVCPEGLGMAPVIKETRQEMVTQGRMPPSAHDFALRNMAFSNGAKSALSRNAPGTVSSTAVFFPGCQLAGSSPEQVERAYGYLREKLGNVGLMLRCCGAPADWAGRSTLFRDSLQDLKAELAGLGNPKLVLACSSCYQVFKANLPEVPIVSLWEVYEEYGLPAGFPGVANAAERMAVAIHDPCTTRHERKIQDSVRTLVERLGYAVEELPLSRERTECCSYGGVMWLANRPVADAVVRRRISESPADYLTYCAVCRDFFARRGKRTLHLLDLIDGLDPNASAERPCPGLSQRQENRARLKRKLLAELWGERMSEEQVAWEKIRLVIPEDVQARLDDRLILDDDVRQVIDHAERTGRKLVAPATGHLLAYYRPTAVTYWVEYAPHTAPEELDRAFVVFNAYSHRMQISDGGAG